MLVLICTLIMIPFCVLTVIRFSANEGVVYNFYSYFSTGPYSFNSAYTARVEYEVPPMNGYLTASITSYLCDKLYKTEIVKNGKELLDLYSEGMKEYRCIDGSYSGEFKTIVGSFLADFSPPVVITIFTIISLCFIFIFQCSYLNTPAIQFSNCIYIYTLMTGAFGYTWGLGVYNLFLTSSIVFFILLLLCGSRKKHVIVNPVN